jgi:hypothetical protein
MNCQDQTYTDSSSPASHETSTVRSGRDFQAFPTTSTSHSNLIQFCTLPTREPSNVIDHSSISTEGSRERMDMLLEILDIAIGIASDKLDSEFDLPSFIGDRDRHFPDDQPQSRQ